MNQESRRTATALLAQLAQLDSPDELRDRHGIEPGDVAAVCWAIVGRADDETPIDADWLKSLLPTTVYPSSSFDVIQVYVREFQVFSYSTTGMLYFTGVALPQVQTRGQFRLLWLALAGEYPSIK